MFFPVLYLQMPSSSESLVSLTTVTGFLACRDPNSTSTAGTRGITSGNYSVIMESMDTSGNYSVIMLQRNHGINGDCEPDLYSLNAKL